MPCPENPKSSDYNRTVKCNLFLNTSKGQLLKFRQQLVWQNKLFCLESEMENLITESEDEVQQEDNGVDDGDGSLGNANVLPVIVQGDPLVVVVLNGQDTTGGEQDHTTQTVEEVLKTKIFIKN